jgi:internalin A
MKRGYAFALLFAVTFVHAGERDDKAAALVKKWGGTFLRDGKSKDIVEVKLVYSKIDDEALADLSGLQQLHELDLYGVRLTDSGLKNLRDLPSLVNLNLRITRITDEGVKELARFKKLQIINVGDTKISGDGLAQLHGLPDLHT